MREAKERKRRAAQDEEEARRICKGLNSVRQRMRMSNLRFVLKSCTKRSRRRGKGLLKHIPTLVHKTHTCDYDSMCRVAFSECRLKASVAAMKYNLSVPQMMKWRQYRAGAYLKMQCCILGRLAMLANKTPRSSARSDLRTTRLEKS